MKQITLFITITFAFLLLPPLAYSQADINTLIQLGKANQEQGNLKTAYTYYTQAMKIDANNPEASRLFWGMKNQYDVRALSDRGPAITSLEEKKNEQREEPSNQNTQNNEVEKPAASQTSNRANDTVRATRQTETPRVVYVDSSNRTVDRKMQNIDEKLTALNSELKDLKNNEKQSEEKNTSSFLTTPMLFLIGVIFCLLFLLALFAMIFKMRMRRIPTAPQYYQPPSNPMLIQANPETDNYKMLALTMAKSLAGNAGTDRGEVKKIVAQLAFDKNDIISRESNRLLTSMVQEDKENSFQITERSSQNITSQAESYIEGYLQLLEQKYPFDHSKRVKYFAEEVGLRIGLSKPEISELKIAALLENIGFLRIPDAILNKNSQLSKSEMEEILLHPVYSGELATSMMLPANIIESVRCHHERYNGNGYPNRIGGSEIPLYARIIGICDSFAALTTEKPFRDPMSTEDAIAVLKKESFLFDPDMLRAFVDAISFAKATESSVTRTIIVNN